MRIFDIITKKSDKEEIKFFIEKYTSSYKHTYLSLDKYIKTKIYDEGMDKTIEKGKSEFDNPFIFLNLVNFDIV